VGRGVVCCGLCRPAVFFFLVCCVVEKPCVLLAVQTRGGVQCAMRMRNAACSPPAGRRRQRTSHFAVGGRWGGGFCFKFVRVSPPSYEVFFEA
jgi:hypothetical protein